METRLLTSLGRIAGLGGIALGLVLLLYKDFLRQKFLPAAGLESAQGYHILLAFLVFTFGIAAIGVVAWIIGQTTKSDSPVPFGSLVILFFLSVAVMITASAVGLMNTSPKNSETPLPQAMQDKPFTATPQGAVESAASGKASRAAPADCVLEKYRGIVPTTESGDLNLKMYQAMLPGASDAGDYDCVKTIIDKGADVNDDATSMRPLMWAAQKGHDDVKCVGSA